MKTNPVLKVAVALGLALPALANGQSIAAKVDFRYKGMESTNALVKGILQREVVPLDDYVAPLVQRKNVLEKEGAAFKQKVASDPSRSEFGSQGQRLYENAIHEFAAFTDALALDIRSQQPVSADTLQAIENCDEAVAAFIGHSQETQFFGILADLFKKLKVLRPVVAVVRESNRQEREAIIAAVRKDLKIKAYESL